MYKIRGGIKVFDCGAFYVYYLRPPIGCPKAYCAGTQIPCQSGMVKKAAAMRGRWGGGGEKKQNFTLYIKKINLRWKNVPVYKGGRCEIYSFCPLLQKS